MLTGALHISQEHPDPTQAPTFSPGPQSPDFPPELPLQPLSPEGSEPGFGDQGGGPSQRQIHRPLPYPGLQPRGSGGPGERLPHFLQKLNMQSMLGLSPPSRPKVQQPLRVE